MTTPNHPLNDKLEGTTPEGTPILHGADGIQELDNPMPRWMTSVFWFTIVWGLLYLILMPGAGINVFQWSQYGQYNKEVETAKATYGDQQAGDPKALLAAAIGNKDAEEKGKAIFTTNCAACHGPEGKGAIGPNLTDATWLYGGEPEAIVKTISEGTAKGMPPFKSSLSGEQLADLAAFVTHLGK